MEESYLNMGTRTYTKFLVVLLFRVGGDGIRYLFIYNVIATNLVTSNDIGLLSHGFYGLVWARLRWVLCSGSYKLQSRC